MKYFNGEKFIIGKGDEKEKESYSNELINQKYIKGEMRIVTEQGRYPLPTLKELFSKGQSSNIYNMNPEFQRRRRWSNIKKSKLIESFIINVPIPPVFLYEVSYANYEVMDGLQRISTIIDFYDNKFSLEGLEVWKELNGMKYSDLPDKIKNGIDRRYLSSIIILNESAKDENQADFLKKIVFQRLNSGGVKLNSQETRNALYNGNLNELCKELSTNNMFKKMWNIEENSEIDEDYSNLDSGCQNELYRSMGDVELVLRFFAFRFLDQYNLKLEDFLDEFLIQGNQFNYYVLNQYKKLFEFTIELAYKLFSDNAFMQYREIRGKWDWRNSSRTIYDPLMQALSKYYGKFDNNKINYNLEQNKKELISFYQTNSDDFNGKKQGKNDINKRIMLFDQLLDKILKSKVDD